MAERAKVLAAEAGKQAWQTQTSHLDKFDEMRQAAITYRPTYSTPISVLLSSLEPNAVPRAFTAHGPPPPKHIIGFQLLPNIFTLLCTYLVLNAFSSNYRPLDLRVRKGQGPEKHNAYLRSRGNFFPHRRSCGADC